MTQLTSGAIEAMHKGQQIRSPLVQVIDVKKILGPNGQATVPERYRLVISDGVHFQQAMLATQLNELVNDRRLQPKCVIRLNEYICNTVHGRRIVIVLSVELMGPPLGQTIGNPQNIEAPTGNDAAAGGGTSVPQSAPAPARLSQPSRPLQPGASGRGSAAPVPALPEGVIPIKGLNPYQNRWTIKARVTAKTDMRTFTSARGPSQLFSLDLLDAFGGEIRCTFFGEAAQQWHDVVQVGNVYLLGRGNVKYANKRYSALKNDYEISLDRNALVQECEDDRSIPHNNFKFVDIGDLKQHQKDEFIDIISVVLEVGSLEDITTKAGNNLQKRVIKVGDASHAQVELTLWGDQAAEWNNPRGTVIMFSGLKVSDFNDRSLTMLRNTKIEVEPHNSDAERVRNWFETSGQGDVPSVSNSEARGRGRGADGSFGGGEKRNWDETRKTFAQIKKSSVAGGSMYFSVRATITEIKHSRDHPPWYEACPTEGCNKKVTPMGGSYHCAKCNATYESFKPRYILSINANDHSGSSWLTCFNDTASNVLNDTSAEQLLNWLSQGDNAHYEEVFQKALFQTYSLRVRASESEYDNEPKVKLSVVKVTPMDYAKESKLLINSISKYLSTA